MPQLIAETHTSHDVDAGYVRRTNELWNDRNKTGKIDARKLAQKVVYYRRTMSRDESEFPTVYVPE